MATNTIKVADLARVQDIDFVNRFNGNAKKLLEVLGVTETIKMAPGTQIKVYKTSGTLGNAGAGAGAWKAETAYDIGDKIKVGYDVYEVTDAGTSGSTAPTWSKTGDVDDGASTTAMKWTYLSSTFNTNVAEGEDIPLSKYDNALAATYALDFEKWRKQTTLEAIAKRGYTQAVTGTDNAMVLDIQKGIRDNIFQFLATGTGTASGVGFQKALANAWGNLAVKFENDSATPVYFVAPLDVAGYLGSASVTLQTAFGFSYIENFLGLGTVIVDSKVPQGKIFATAQENLNVYSVDAAGIEGFEFYSDETALIGVHHDSTYTNATLDTVAISAMKVFPEYLDRIIVSTIGS